MPARLPEGVPDTVTVRAGMMLAPQEMRDLAAVTGRPLSEVLDTAGGEDDLDAAPDRTQALVWTVLRRLGHDVTWAQAGQVVPVMGEPLDPTNAGPSRPSLDSAGTGE
jgi:hypothetical protein